MADNKITNSPKGKRYCCDAMKENIHPDCDIHTGAECPDKLIEYTEKIDQYGLIIRDGSNSVYVIDFCPWCATPLPNKSDEWFNRLEALGYDSPLFRDDIPEEFKTGAWYAKKKCKVRKIRKV